MKYRYSWNALAEVGNVSSVSVLRAYELCLAENSSILLPLYFFLLPPLLLPYFLSNFVSLLSSQGGSRYPPPPLPLFTIIFLRCEFKVVTFIIFNTFLMTKEIEAGTWGVMVAVGPGVRVEAILLRW